MYQVGELIVYGSTGVCEVVGHEKMKFAGAGTVQVYYVLRPLDQDGTIYTPAENPKVFMRPVISRTEAERLIDTIPTLDAEAYHDRSIQLLAAHYEEALQTHDCADLIELTMSIYAKKQYLEERRRRFGSVDERFMKRAEDLLFGELGAALEIPKDEVQGFISTRLQKSMPVKKEA